MTLLAFRSEIPLFDHLVPEGSYSTLLLPYTAETLTLIYRLRVSNHDSLHFASRKWHPPGLYRDHRRGRRHQNDLTFNETLRLHISEAALSLKYPSRFYCLFSKVYIPAPGDVLHPCTSQYVFNYKLLVLEICKSWHVRACHASCNLSLIHI